MTNEIRRDPLEEALDEQVVTLHRLTTKVWLWFFAAGVVVGGLVAMAVHRTLGLACAALAAVYFLWNLWVHRRLREGALSPRLLLVAEGVEGMAPWLVMAIMAGIKGPQYALASWVPPMFFVGLVLMQVLRLRIYSPIVLGVVSSLALLALYFGVMKERLPEVYASNLVYQPSMQVTRAMSVLLTGLVGSIASRYFRQIIVRAGVTVRERELFGKYRLLHKLAQGGMGTVWEALYCPEGGFERRVAIKLIHAHLSGQERFVRLFREEAELSSRLAHPNIVQVLDFGRAEGGYFLALEYVDGITLAAFLKRATAQGVQVPTEIVGTVLRDLLAALEHAHDEARGSDGSLLRVVHRDVCPQNVLLSKNGMVKLTDFGLARALRDSHSSQTQTVSGHLAYMAPEQARAERMDTRVDLFGVGVIAWELMAGRRLFERGDDAATLFALVFEEIPSATSERPDVESTWEALIRRALARQPEERFASAREMREALDGIVSARKKGAHERLAELVTRLSDVSVDDADSSQQTRVVS